MLERYIAKLYIKYSLLILFSLVFFFVGIDLLTEFTSLPDSANLVSLYIAYQVAYSVDTVLPLSLIFGAIITKIHLIRVNELVASYALGSSRLRVLKPFVLTALLFSFVYILLSMSDIAYSYEKAKNIKKNRVHSSVTNDIFLKYNESFVYIETLLPIQKMVKNIDIVELENNELSRYISAKSGFFFEDAWRLTDVTITTKPKVSAIADSGIELETLSEYRTLKGFKPKLMDSVYESKTTFSLIDAVSAWILFENQGVNTDKVRGVFYSSIFFPLFAPLFVIIIFFAVPISPRFFNVALFSSVAVLITLVGWGVLFSISQMARNGTLQPEFALLLPFFIVVTVAGYLIKKEPN